jgi:hypothetical protein
LLQFFHQRFVLLLQPVELAGIVEGHAQFVLVPGLGDVAEHAARVDGADDHLHVAEARQDHPHCIGVEVE